MATVESNENAIVFVVPTKIVGFAIPIFTAIMLFYFGFTLHNIFPSGMEAIESTIVGVVQKSQHTMVAAGTPEILAAFVNVCIGMAAVFFAYQIPLRISKIQQASDKAKNMYLIVCGTLAFYVCVSYVLEIYSMLPEDMDDKSRQYEHLMLILLGFAPIVYLGILTRSLFPEAYEDCDY